MPYRPPIPASCAHLDLKRAYQALLKSRGNISAAAKKLKVPVTDFRMLARFNPQVSSAAQEAEEMALDHAEATLRAALDGPDQSRRLQAAAYIIRVSPAARRRGFAEASKATGDPLGRPPVIKMR